ncbi:MAG: phosphate transport system regulatory protein PhoU [Alphaproteobacteria bacterium]|nr:MAG: phosphate transport system regulatory protein PhoU [Alphaproteobacteria bacterium]
MTNTPHHIVRSFDEELRGLSEIIVRMGGMAEAQLAAAIDALVKRDADMAARVVQQDAAIDALEERLDHDAIRLLALRQPLADDLREVIAALKISSDLERIGDYAANVAKRAIAICQTPPIEPVRAIPRMGRLVQAIIKDTLDAYVARDADRAIDVWHRDEEVDEMYTALFRELLTYMMEDPRNITAGTHLLFIAKNIERIGDHATNIAETIHYLVTGRRLEGGRPKGDTSSFEVVRPAPQGGAPEGNDKA